MRRGLEKRRKGGEAKEEEAKRGGSSNIIIKKERSVNGLFGGQFRGYEGGVGWAS